MARKWSEIRHKKDSGAESRVEEVAPNRTLTYTHGPDAVTIEDLSVVPPIRAHGASEAQAEAAYEHQRELRSRHDAQADTEGPGVQTSDLTPGRV